MASKKRQLPELDDAFRRIMVVVTKGQGFQMKDFPVDHPMVATYITTKKNKLDKARIAARLPALVEEGSLTKIGERDKTHYTWNRGSNRLKPRWFKEAEEKIPARAAKKVAPAKKATARHRKPAAPAETQAKKHVTSVAKEATAAEGSVRLIRQILEAVMGHSAKKL